MRPAWELELDPRCWAGDWDEGPTEPDPFPGPPTREVPALQLEELRALSAAGRPRGVAPPSR